jgi:hypothetical protein
MLAHPNPRAQERFRIRCWLTISVRRWKLLARAVDMSASGAMIESLFPVSVGSFVRMRSQVNLLGGGAYVRHCERRGWRYRIGLQFGYPVTARF